MEQQDAVALCRIGRAKHVQIGREVHPPIGITSRMIEIDDANVVRIGGSSANSMRPTSLSYGPVDPKDCPPANDRSRGDGDARHLR